MEQKYISTRIVRAATSDLTGGSSEQREFMNSIDL